MIALLALLALAQDNMLTDDEKKDGWTLLFDGKSLDGWRGYKKTEAPKEGWAVVDGAIVLSKPKVGDLITAKQYADFELSIDWKVAPGGNSGIIYRASESQAQPYLTGMEYQVLDDAAHRDGKNQMTSAGALYAVYAPSKAVVKPAGEWNRTRIVANGAKVEHWLNGEKIVEAEIGSSDWKERVAKSKWAKVPTYAGESKGHISLQEHGDKVEYKNIKIRELK